MYCRMSYPIIERNFGIAECVEAGTESVLGRRVARLDHGFGPYLELDGFGTGPFLVQKHAGQGCLSEVEASSFQ